MCELVGPGPGRREALVCEPVGPGPERRESLVREPPPDCLSGASTVTLRESLVPEPVGSASWPAATLAATKQSHC